MRDRRLVNLLRRNDFEQAAPVLGAGVTLRPAGPRALLAEFADLAQVRDYYAEARRRQADGALSPTIEVVPAARTILFDELDDPAALARDLRSWQPGPAARTPGRDVTVPTVYDGPDLADVARLWGMTAAEAVACHTALTYEVAFLGFAPGFAYLVGLPDRLALPRRARPRTRVPAGSVALAARFTGVYPRPSPGGWQLVGRTDLSMWDPDAEPAATLLPGDRVRFTSVPG